MKTLKVKFALLFIACVFGIASVFAQEGYVEHKIAKGETLYSIAEKYGVTVAEIKKANPKAGNYFYAGMTIQIPKNRGDVNTNPIAVGDNNSNNTGNNTNYMISPKYESTYTNESDEFEKNSLTTEFGYGFIEDAFALKYAIGTRHSFTKSFYVGAQIAYNHFNLHRRIGGKYDNVIEKTKMHFIYLPLETGYKFMTEDGKWGIIPFAGLGLNIGLKGKTKIDYIGDDYEEEYKLKVGGKLGLEGRIGVHVSLAGFLLSASYHLPLNSKQEGFFGEDAYPEISIGFGI